MAQNADSAYFAVTARDFDVGIHAAGKGFRIEWTSVIRRGGDPRHPNVRHRKAVKVLQPYGKPGVFRCTDSGDPLAGKDLCWARIDGDEAVLGITWFAADALGELVHFEPPAGGASIVKDESYGEVESVKAVSDLISPLSGEVLEVNQLVVDAPETVNDDPYGNGWLVRIRLSDPGEAGALLDADAYRQLIADQ